MRHSVEAWLIFSVLSHFAVNRSARFCEASEGGSKTVRMLVNLITNKQCPRKLTSLITAYS